METYDVVIIGAGPSGLTAAIYARRYNLSTCVFEKETPGGQVTKTSVINNYPGFDEISGYELSSKMLNQAIKNNVLFKYEEIIKIEPNEDKTYTLTAKNYNKENKIIAKAVIIAIGTINNTLNIPSEKKYFYKGISWCATCDGPLCKNKNVCVVGGGNSAISEAHTLSRIANKVYVIMRKESFRNEGIEAKALKELDNVEIINNAIITELSGSDTLEKVHILRNNSENIEINTNYLFECLGKSPNTSIFKGIIDLTNGGYIKCNNKMETNMEGIFACGDVIEKDYRQIATAVNDGAIAAIQANEYLKNVFFK